MSVQKKISGADYTISSNSMADKKHIEIFQQGIKCWNDWRDQNPSVQPDLSHENLAGWNAAGITQWNMGADGVNLENANLWNTDLSGTGLIFANLKDAILIQSNLQKACLIGASLEKANLLNANLRSANLTNANLEDANVSGVKYNRFAKYRGIRTATCYGSPRFRRFCQDQDFIEELKEESAIGRILYWLWLIFTDCGRSFWPILLWLLFISIMFGSIYAGYEIPAWLSWLPDSLENLLTTIRPQLEFKYPQTWFSPYYFSFVTLTTLGSGDITPLNTAGQLFVLTEVLIGYVILGLLISILANKIARRS
jgi:hypothetical protein